MDTNTSQIPMNSSQNAAPQPQYNTYPQAIYYPPMAAQMPAEKVDMTKIERLLENNNILQNAVLERQNDIYTMLQNQIRMQNITRILHFIKTAILIIVAIWGIMSLKSSINKGVLGSTNMLSNIQNIVSEQPKNTNNKAIQQPKTTVNSGNFITNLQREFEKALSKFVPPNIK